jgi:GDP-mannose 6-dehydrogenase
MGRTNSGIRYGNKMVREVLDVTQVLQTVRHLRAVEEAPASRSRDVAVRPSISVVGLGYVGAVSMACLSHLGFRMIGIDTSEVRVDAINRGVSPIVENRLEDLLHEGVARGLISATHSLIGAVLRTDVTFVSVGTPTAPDGGCDFTYVRDASRTIGRALAAKDDYHVVVMRCSIPPGTTRDVVIPEIEAASGKKLGEDFGVCFNPEFLREGVAVADFFAPPKTVIGASDMRARAMVEGIYTAIDQNAIFTSIEAAEMVKYADNVWHANKVAFANEIGRLCKAMHIDSHDVMDIFVKDQKLNISPYYLKPGFAFGGSCLPKEVRAVSHLAKGLGVKLPLIDSLIPSNQEHVSNAVDILARYAGKRIGFLGMTFKTGTDDLRESPTIDLMAALDAKGETIRAYDANVKMTPHMRGQIDYLKRNTPRLKPLLDRIESIRTESLNEIVENSDVLVVSHATEEFRRAVTMRDKGVCVVDLARLFRGRPKEEGYEGIAW